MTAQADRLRARAIDLYRAALSADPAAECEWVMSTAVFKTFRDTVPGLGDDLPVEQHRLFGWRIVIDNAVSLTIRDARE